MKLTDLRKLAIRRHLRIRFALRNGMECVISEQGVAQVPGIKSVPDFNLEEELSSASRFLLDPVEPVNKKKPAAAKAPVSTAVSREELAGMTAGGAAAEAPSHDDD